MLKKAIKDTGWEGKFTEEGLRKASANIWREGSKLYYAPENWAIYDKYSGDKKDGLREKGLLKEWTDKNGVVTAYALRITQEYGKLYSESSINKYGKLFMDEFKDLMKSSGGTGDTTNIYMNQRLYTTGEYVPGRYYGNIPPMRDQTPMDNQPSTRQTQSISQDTQTAVSSFVERLDKSTNTKDLVKNLKDAPDTELSAAGFSEEYINQVRDSVDFINNAQTIIAEKDMKIGELKKQIIDNEDKIANLRKEIIKSKEKDISFMNKLEGDIKKVIEENKELRKQLEVKTKEAFELLSGEESQVKRLKYLIRDVLKNPDSRISLKDRIKSLFKLDGITIGSIITAVVATITSIALAISLSLKSVIAPKPGPPEPPGPGPQPDPKPDIPNKVKEVLKKFAEWLKELAKKSFAALPAIIGSIVSFILKSAAAAVGFLAEHMIILVIIIVSSIVEGVRYIKKSGK